MEKMPTEVKIKIIVNPIYINKKENQKVPWNLFTVS